MKYFPSWTEHHILWGMSYDNFMMYMASIPDYDEPTTDEGKDEAGSSPTAPKAAQTKVTGYKTLFDL